MDAINGFSWSEPLYPVVLPACVYVGMESGLDRVGMDRLVGAAAAAIWSPLPWRQDRNGAIGC